MNDIYQARIDEQINSLFANMQGRIPVLRGILVWSAPLTEALTDESCAIVGCESCQVGDQAALSSFEDVPQGRLFRANVTGLRM